MQSLFSFNVAEKAGLDVVNEIMNEIDSITINTLKSIAKPTMVPGNNLQLINSYGVTNGSIGDVFIDLSLYINLMLASIIKDKNRGYDGMVIVSPNVLAALSVTPAFAMTKEENANSVKNTKFVGQILGQINVYVDNLADEDYIIVGYLSSLIGDNGLIFGNYSITTTPVVNPDTGIEEMFVNVRYGLTRNPRDYEDGNGTSEYFRYLKVDFSGLQNWFV